MKKIIIIVGPTSSGKSSYAIEIAKNIDAEIINADCFQVYQEMNVGTNKPTIDEMKNIKHYLINLIKPDEEWNIKKFKENAEKIIDNSKKNIIIVGGSNLYIDCLVKNYDLSNKSRTNKFSLLSDDELFLLLEKENVDIFRKIGRNRKRAERALEILQDGRALTNTNLIKYSPFFIFINPNREELYKKINARVDEMFDKGWIEEVKQLSKKYDDNINAFKAIGYKTLLENDMIDSEFIREKIKKETRNYAKRQLTWCRNKFKIDLEKNNNILTNEDIEMVRGFLNE